MSGKLVEVEVRALASGGDGVAELPDGRVVFVPRTTEGDRARVRVEKERANWARASLVELLEPSGLRTEAPCTRYAECGGCQLQHVPYDEQLRWKGRFVADALERIGGRPVDAPTVHPSAEPFRYRSRMTYTLRRLRGGRVVAGLHAEGRPAHVLDITDECLLPEPSVGRAWETLRRAWGPGARLLPPSGRLRLTLRRSGPPSAERDARVDLVVHGGAPGWDAAPLFEACGDLGAIWHLPDTGASDRTDPAADADDAAEGARLLAGTAPDGARPAFEQVNPSTADQLRATVLELCGVPESADHARAIDAYCGAGILGRTLAAHGWRVTGIELDPDAVAAARARPDNAGTEEDDPEVATAGGAFSVEQGRVEERLPDRLPTDLLVLNPPRRGLHEAVPELVAARPARRIVYVSCDPATLARDLSRLGDRYRMDALSAFDLFPQTAHVETVVGLTLTDPEQSR